MPIFTVLCQRDAYAIYSAEVSANSAEEAAIIAERQHDKQSWSLEPEIAEFDACLYVTLDDHGEEIAGTEQGKLAWPKRLATP